MKFQPEQCFLSFFLSFLFFFCLSFGEGGGELTELGKNRQVGVFVLTFRNTN